LAEKGAIGETLKATIETALKGRRNELWGMAYLAKGTRKGLRSKIKSRDVEMIGEQRGRER